MRLTATGFQHEWPSAVNALGNRLCAIPGQRYHGEVLRCNPGREYRLMESKFQRPSDSGH